MTSELLHFKTLTPVTEVCVQDTMARPVRITSSQQNLASKTWWLGLDYFILTEVGVEDLVAVDISELHHSSRSWCLTLVEAVTIVVTVEQLPFPGYGL